MKTGINKCQGSIGDAVKDCGGSASSKKRNSLGKECKDMVKSMTGHGESFLSASESEDYDEEDSQDYEEDSSDYDWDEDEEDSADYDWDEDGEDSEVCIPFIIRVACV